MTTSTNTTAVVQTVRTVLKGAKASFADVFRALHTPEPIEQNAIPAPDLPKNVTPTEAQLAALVALPELLAGYTAPTTRRKLTAAERRTLIEVTRSMREIESLVKATRGSVRTSFLNHGDVVAEEEGTVNPLLTPRDSNGHYLIKDEDDFAIPGLDVQLNRKLTSPGVGISQELVEGSVVKDGEPGEGELTHKEWLWITDLTRTLNMDKVTALIRKRPEAAVVFQNAAAFTGGSVALTEAKNSN